MLAVINSAVVLQLLDNLFVRIIWVNKANVRFTGAQRKQIRGDGYQRLEFAKGNKGQIDCFLAEIIANCGVLVFRVDCAEKQTSSRIA